MLTVARKRRPWMLVIGELHKPSLGPAVHSNRTRCELIAAAGEYFPIDAVGLFNSWNSRFPMPLHVWARYFGEILTLSTAVKVYGGGRMADAIVRAQSSWKKSTIFDERTAAEKLHAATMEDLEWSVLQGLKDPRPTCYVAGPYSMNPALCTARAFARATVLLDEHCPIIPFIAHDIDCATPQKYEHWLDLDANLLCPCKTICRGAGPSRGADLEMRVAEALRIGSIPDGPYNNASQPWMEPARLMLANEVYDTKGL